MSEMPTPKTNTTLPPRTLEGDIVAFTQALPYWAQFLAERLLSGWQLSDADYQQAYQFLLEDAGLLEKSARTDIKIVCKGGFGDYKNDLQLKKITGVMGINALVPDQVLELGANLTIIYGANGSGKSGYIRLLNNVFITKGDKTILPNIHDTGTPAIKAAEFTFESDGKTLDLKYPEDCGEAVFKQFSVFDEKAVHAHLNQKNQFEFRPAGLSFFADLNESYKKMEELMQTNVDIKSLRTDYTALFDGESGIKTLLSQLSAKTEKSDLQGFMPFTAEDKAERIKLEAAKAELMALKKDKEIEDLQQQHGLLETLKQSTQHINRFFSDEQLTKAANKIKDCLLKEQAASSHDISQFEKAGHQEIGGIEWREFLTAADAFARKQDKEDMKYAQPDDNCLFCQQPLTAEARALINTYWSFIKSKAEQENKDAQAALQSSKDALSKIDLKILPDTGILHKWLTENHAAELAALTKQLKAQKSLQAKLVADIEAKKVNAYEAVQIDTVPLDTLMTGITTKIAELNEDKPMEAVEKLQKQITLLNHREKLADHLPGIEKAIDNLKWCDSAAKAKSKINKRDITNREKELSGLYFNQAYIDQFNAECTRLKGDFGINVNHTGSGGTSFRQLTLKGKTPSDILSEGEQKVISLADFLAETILSGVNKGIVFDDPVNSLDEKRKGNIAERLINESANRQIVVFTHDLVFVSQMITFCQENGREHVCHWIEQRDGKPGYISLKNAPSYEKEYRNQNIPLKYAADAKKIGTSAKEREFLIKEGFTSLRTCYETLVINSLFKNVVQRFNERISMEAFKEVNFTTEMRNELYAGFTECCKYMEGHSHSDALPYRKPELSDLDAEIQRYIDIRAQIHTKSPKP